MFDDRTGAGNPVRIALSGAAGDSQQHFPEEAPRAAEELSTIAAAQGFPEAASCASDPTLPKTNHPITGAQLPHKKWQRT